MVDQAAHPARFGFAACSAPLRSPRRARPARVHRNAGSPPDEERFLSLDRPPEPVRRRKRRRAPRRVARAGAGRPSRRPGPGDDSAPGDTPTMKILSMQPPRSEDQAPRRATLVRSLDHRHAGRLASLRRNTGACTAADGGSRKPAQRTLRMTDGGHAGLQLRMLGKRRSSNTTHAHHPEDPRCPTLHVWS